MQAPLNTRNDSDSANADTTGTTAQKRDFVDNRLKATTQRKLAEMTTSSSQVKQQEALSDAIHNSQRMVAQREEKSNNTGLPNRLKSGIESLSGLSMDHVKVHYNSDKPAQFQAHAYAQGNEIYLGAGQEKHLAHEAWHVVQQAQGRVRPTLQMKAGAVNNDPLLEQEADFMGEKAAQFESGHDVSVRDLVKEERVAGPVTQQVTGFGQLGEKVATPSALPPSTQLKINVEVEKTKQTTDTAVIQAYGIVNVTLDVDDDNTTVYISNISFHERVPTDANGGKGDHVVAESLITSSLLNVKNCTPDELLAYLEELARTNLGGMETAKHTDREYEERRQIDCEKFFAELEKGIEGVHPVKLAARLGELCTMYWRLLEKRSATAFIRAEGKTTGGSGGTDEAAGMKLLDEIDHRFQALDTSQWHEIFTQQEPIARILHDKMMDLVASTFSNQEVYYLCHRAATAVALKLKIGNTGWINQVAAYAYKHFTNVGIGPRKPGANPFL